MHVINKLLQQLKLLWLILVLGNFLRKYCLPTSSFIWKKHRKKETQNDG